MSRQLVLSGSGASDVVLQFHQSAVNCQAGMSSRFVEGETLTMGDAVVVYIRISAKSRANPIWATYFARPHPHL